ncbi:MAG: hypothetical protein LBT13_07675, partial [Treponema sp.]|nr:hypothetical protein [Treponema sp.]
MNLADLDVLLPYQKAWIADRSQLKIWEKGRRTGASWTEALNAVLETQGKQGQHTYYLSYNKDMTRQFIVDCAFWARLVNVAAGELEETIIQDDDTHVTVYRIRFLNDKEIVAMPSTAYSIRSKQGRIVLDEAAFAPEFDEVIKAALALLMWGGSLAIISTHNGDDRPFNLLIKKIRDGKEPRWSLHRTSFTDAVKDGLYKRICLTRGKGWTAKSETEWVAEIRDIYKDNAEEELDAIPSRSGAQYFPYGMLVSCASPAVEIVRLNCKDSFMWEPPRKRLEEIETWFEVEGAPILRQLTGVCFLGQDFARSGNLSVLWLG